MLLLEICGILGLAADIVKGLIFGTMLVWTFVLIMLEKENISKLL
jgi:hypothetical protein